MRFCFLISFFLTVVGHSQTTIKDVDQVVGYMLKKTEGLERIDLNSSDEDEKFMVSDSAGSKIFYAIEKGTIVKKVSWFFQRDTLIYTETTWTDSRTNKRTYHEKTYHYKGLLFAWLNSENKFMDANSAAFRSLDKRLQTYSIQLLKETTE